MISDARGGHVSPGMYTEERDVKYTVNSLGITSLALVGETLKGAAFQNIPIKSWTEFVDYFGGTSTEKYKANGRPKYELPYVAKEYLKESKKLNVVRVLGLSGYDAGPAWVLYNTDSKPVLVLRSRMSYGEGGTSICEPKGEKVEPITMDITKTAYKTKTYDSNCNDVVSVSSAAGKNWQIGIKVDTNKGTFNYNVSLKSSDKDYIYNVLPMAPDSSFPIYVESVFENHGFDNLNKNFKKETGVVTGYTCYRREQDKETQEWSYRSYSGATEDEIEGAEIQKEVPTTGVTENSTLLIKIANMDDYYQSFRSAFRYAQTPWIVSNILSDGDQNLTMKKLFRVMTISDGNAANYQVKISIENIDPVSGTFTLVVRDFYDTDYSPVVLERYSRCNLVEGDANYLPYRVGSSDGVYEAKSK